MYSGSKSCATLALVAKTRIPCATNDADCPLYAANPMFVTFAFVKLAYPGVKSMIETEPSGSFA